MKINPAQWTWHRQTTGVLIVYMLMCLGSGIGYWTDTTLWYGRVWAVMLLFASLMCALTVLVDDWFVQSAGVAAFVAFLSRPVGALVQALSHSGTLTWQRFIIVESFWLGMAGVSGWVFPAIARIRDTVDRHDVGR